MLLIPVALLVIGNSWAFDPPRDTFRPDAILDLRYLNEKVAGETGYVRADANGDFVLGNGRPVRFWAVNTGVGRDKPFHPRPLGRQTEPDLDVHARFLAKHGVNMIRLHAQLSPGPDEPIENVNSAERDWIWRSVGAMKKQGIYTTISPYWGVAAKIGKAWHVPGGSQNALGLLFFDPTLQRGYRTWLRALLAEKNPYTGIPLAKDPALAILELQNEDSLLFWTVNNVKGEQRANLERLYGQWLDKKYGSLDKAFDHWQGDKLPGDDPSKGLVDFHNVWEMTQNRTGGRQARLADQLEFWTSTMRDFNAGTVKFLRDDIGYKGLVNAGNWRTADSARLFDAERYSYTSTDVDAVNRYFSGVHQGKDNGWAIENGDRFTSPSALLQPDLLPINCKQTLGRPMIVTESSWVMPAQYAAEAPFLISAYQSLNGVDAYYWFATGDDQWTSPESANGYAPSQAKWLFGNPDMLGGFYAAALMYRGGYVSRATPSVIERRSLDDLWQRRIPLLSEEGGFDPNRDSGDMAPTSSVKTPVDPLAFLVGPVCVEFGKDASTSHAANLNSLISRKEGTVKSATGQLTLDWKRGFCTIDSPCAQGVAAFFKNRSAFVLSDLSIISKNDYGTILAVSLDGKPLKSSSDVLVQVGTESRPTDWSDKLATIALDGGKTVEGREVVSYGKAPWQVVSARFNVKLGNPKISKAMIVDANGYPVGTVPLQRTPTSVSFAFPNSALYVVLR